MFKGLRQLPLLGKELAGTIKTLLITNDEFSKKRNCWYGQQDIMENICKRMIETLQLQGVTDVNAPFLIDHVPSMLGRITDAQLKSRLWLGN